jgi:hypothetical protein
VFFKGKRETCASEIHERKTEYLGVTLVILVVKKKVYASRAIHRIFKRLEALCKNVQCEARVDIYSVCLIPTVYLYFNENAIEDITFT